jgi:fatty acid desaturase
VLVFPRPHAIFKQHIPFDQEPSKIPFAVVQAFVASVILLFVFDGGVVKFVIFEVAFCFMWSIFQNVAHYGLCGIDPATDRLCARTYILEKPFRVLTFGSFSHFAHHADMQIPGAYLHKIEVLSTLENELGIELEVKRGIWELAADLVRQFKGPLTEAELTSSWIKKLKDKRVSNSKRVSMGYSHRSGRKWVSMERQS